MTPTVAALYPLPKLLVLNRVREFDQFSPENDPYGEHDFGAVEVQGETYYWKIDYYDLALCFHSPDPANPAVTRRVLTIMHSSEY